MTPYRLTLRANDYNERKKAEDEEKLTLTWLGAFWVFRAKRMPSLNQILGKEQVKKTMTPDEILAEVKKLNQAYGGNVY